MFALIRRNRRPTILRRLLSAVTRKVPEHRPPPTGVLPSHHILCAGTYSPVFARLAAESALAACPLEVRPHFRLFIHVDGVARKAKPELMDWLREIPGVELTYGLFGILPQDRIPGKWHQVMVNDVCREFQSDPHIAFIDADLFLPDASWWTEGLSQLDTDVYSVSLGLRNYACANNFRALKTQLFTLNTEQHRYLNTQRFSKDERAIRRLQKEFPSANFAVQRPDSMVVPSLRAQLHGCRVIDVLNKVPHCHVGGFSHLGFNKFHDHGNPQRQAAIHSWMTSTRLLLKLLNYFEQRGWGHFVDTQYRQNAEKTQRLIASYAELQFLMHELPPSPHELAFTQLTASTA